MYFFIVLALFPLNLGGVYACYMRHMWIESLYMRFDVWIKLKTCVIDAHVLHIHVNDDDTICVACGTMGFFFIDIVRSRMF